MILRIVLATIMFALGWTVSPVLTATEGLAACKHEVQITLLVTIIFLCGMGFGLCIGALKK